MIRQRVHRWLAGRLRPGERLLAQFWILHHFRVTDRYFDWHVATYGEKGDRGGGMPWWDCRIVGPVMMWVEDWRMTASLALGMRCFRKHHHVIPKEWGNGA